MSSVVHLTEGTVFAGEYRVLRPLSEGGMGAVYVVEQMSTGKQRALKVMHPNLVNDVKQRQRFVQEAKIGANIESDHVAEVLGAGVEQDLPWLVMELLQGETLDNRIETRGPIPSKEVAEIFSQLCHAVAAAHEVGIVHRDLKPENVFLSNPRRVGVPFTVKVLDFGIAKLVAESGHTTQAIGSPLWMAPEQTNADATISPATDIWALGLLAFISLTGKSYWKGAHVEVPNPMSIVMEVCFDPLVPASERAAELGVGELIPPGFDGWFAQCVTREVEMRFQKVRGVQAALARVLGDPSAFKAPSLLTPAPMDSAHVRSLVGQPKPTAMSTSGSFEAELDLPKAKQKPEPTPKEEPKKKQVIEIATTPVVPMAAMVERVPSTTMSRAGPRPGVGVARPPRTHDGPVDAPFPWAKSALIGLGAIGVLFLAQRLFWTRPIAAPASSQSAPPTTSPTAPDEKKSPLASAKASGAGVDNGETCGPGMARVPAGELVAGDPAKAVGTFCMDLTEVTVRAYAACVKSGKCTAPATKGEGLAVTPDEKKIRTDACNGLRPDRLDHPVNCVEASQAEAYCKTQKKRLPSDTEWEWATRSAAARVKFPWGTESPDVQLCWSAFKARTSTCVVASYPKGDDAFGIHDLAGNVREWTATASGATGEGRLQCGSDWSDRFPDDLFKLGYCAPMPPKTKSTLVGFRCAM